jgi:hypothetical protein
LLVADLAFIVAAPSAIVPRGRTPCNRAFEGQQPIALAAAMWTTICPRFKKAGRCKPLKTLRKAKARCKQLKISYLIRAHRVISRSFGHSRVIHNGSELATVRRAHIRRVVSQAVILRSADFRHPQKLRHHGGRPLLKFGATLRRFREARARLLPSNRNPERCESQRFPPRRSEGRWLRARSKFRPARKPGS